MFQYLSLWKKKVRKSNKNEGNFFWNRDLQYRPIYSDRLAKVPRGPNPKSLIGTVIKIQIEIYKITMIQHTKIRTLFWTVPKFYNWFFFFVVQDILNKNSFTFYLGIFRTVEFDMKLTSNLLAFFNLYKWLHIGNELAKLYCRPCLY